MHARSTPSLVGLRNQDAAAVDALYRVVYEDLRRRARRALKAQPECLTLSTTALVHESYLKLRGSDELHWQDRAHFLALAARAMRFVLVSHARSHSAQKRGGGRVPLDLDEQLALSDDRAEEMLALNEALDRLAALDERLGRTVEMRYFGGCTVEETAQALGIAGITVMREARLAEAWLRRAMQGANPAA